MLEQQANERTSQETGDDGQSIMCVNRTKSCSSNLPNVHNVKSMTQRGLRDHAKITPATQANMAVVKWLHPVSVAYASTSLGASLMNSVFMFYYVKVFLNRYHVSESWFQASQIVFLIWNALNDPLFGYMQDNFKHPCFKIRRLSILYGAPLFVISFLVPWFPWGDYSQPTWLAGFQLMFALCFYDALFTFVLLAQCSLFAEISHHQADRIRLVRYSQVASFVGSSSVFFTNYFSANLSDFSIFQVTVFFIALISLVCMVYSGFNSHSEYDSSPSGNPLLSESESKSNSGNIWQQGLQIISQVNALSFVFMNFLQVFHITWLANFTGIICDSLIPDGEISSSLRSVFYGALFVAPQIVVILGTSFVGSLGYYRIVNYTFGVKILLGFFLFFIGPTPWIMITFFLLECVNANSAFSLFNLALSDIIDKDKELYKRSHPLSSMVFGINALITKPAQSLAPMFGVFVLNQFGYQQFKAHQAALVKDPLSVTNSVDVRDLHSVMFYLSCSIPVAVGTLQYIIWRFYTIRSTHLSITKYVES